MLKIPTNNRTRMTSNGETEFDRGLFTDFPPPFFHVLTEQQKMEKEMVERFLSNLNELNRVAIRLAQDLVPCGVWNDSEFIIINCDVADDSGGMSCFDSKTGQWTTRTKDETVCGNGFVELLATVFGEPLYNTALIVGGYCAQLLVQKGISFLPENEISSKENS